MSRPIIGRLAAAAIMALSVAWPERAHAQDSLRAMRTYLLEARIGETSAVGERSTRLLDTDAGAVGISFGFELSRRSWGWVSFDFRPMSSPYEPYPLGPRTPAVGMYSITAGMSRRLGPAIGGSHWRPLEVGLGAGATRVETTSMGQAGPVTYPPDAQFEDPDGLGVLSSVRWQPAAVARLQLAFPLGSAFLIGGGISLVATHVGDVQLWDGRWEPTGVGSRYQPTTRVWSFGTTFSAPVTVSLALKL